MFASEDTGERPLGHTEVGVYKGLLRAPQHGTTKNHDSEGNQGMIHLNLATSKMKTTRHHGKSTHEHPVLTKNYGGIQFEA